MSGTPDDPVDGAPKWAESPATVQNRIDFLKAEVELGFTFADLTRSRLESGERESAESSRSNAEKAYATVVRFLADPKHADQITGRERNDLQKAAEELRSMLDDLKRRFAVKASG